MMQGSDPNLKELAQMAGVPTEPVKIVDAPNINAAQAELADEIAEAISDTLDMDWSPSWAAPNIIAIINRERALGRAEAEREIVALRGAVMTVLDAVRDYLPPDGITAHECLTRVIGAVDNPTITPLVHAIERGEHKERQP
jgi:hypothetical protein